MVKIIAIAYIKSRLKWMSLGFFSSIIQGVASLPEDGEC